MIEIFRTMACYVFALGGRNDDTINQAIVARFTALTNYLLGTSNVAPANFPDADLLATLRARCVPGGSSTRPRDNPQINTAETRRMILQALILYCGQVPAARFTVDPAQFGNFTGGLVFAGFRNGQAGPEHMWIRPAGGQVLLDTMPNHLIFSAQADANNSNPALENVPFAGANGGFVTAAFAPGQAPFNAAVALYDTNADLHGGNNGD